MRRTYLDFEEGLRALDRARDAARAQGDAETEAQLLRDTEERSRRICAHLTPWQRVQMSRHIDRPFTLDYVSALCGEFIELHGDRTFGDDAAMVAGLALRGERALAVVGHQRGRGTAEKVRRNFGMPRPEGYRKARRLFRLAAQAGIDVLTFIDTQGAFPGTESEERGIAEAIAGCIAELAGLPVPVVAVVIGEGGSGGALALAVSDALLMLEHSCLAGDLARGLCVDPRAPALARADRPRGGLARADRAASARARHRRRGDRRTGRWRAPRPGGGGAGGRAGDRPRLRAARRARPAGAARAPRPAAARHRQRGGPLTAAAWP